MDLLDVAGMPGPSRFDVRTPVAQSGRLAVNPAATPAVPCPDRALRAGNAEQSGPGQPSGMPTAPASLDAAGACRPRRVGVPGSEASLGDLSHRVEIESLVRGNALELKHLVLDLLRPLRTIGLYATAMRAPKVKGLLRDLNLLRHLRNYRALNCEALRVPELPDDLFRGVPSGHLLTVPPSWPSDFYSYRTTSLVQATGPVAVLPESVAYSRGQ